MKRKNDNSWESKETTPLPIDDVVTVHFLTEKLELGDKMRFEGRRARGEEESGGVINLTKIRTRFLYS